MSASQKEGKIALGVNVAQNDEEELARMGYKQELR
jgi:hypothetical protein